MKKKILLATLTMLMVGFSAGQTLQNFEYSPSSGFEKSLTGGESFTQEINFTNAADRPVPLAVEIKVDGERYNMSSSGAEFDLNEGSIKVEGYSIYEYWDTTISTLGNFAPFKVLELDNPSEGVPERILVRVDACASRDDDQSFSFEIEGWSCDSEDVSVGSAENLSVGNRFEYERNEVDGEVSTESLSQIPVNVEWDNSTVVPVIDSSVDLENIGEIDSSDYYLVPARFAISSDSQLSIDYRQSEDEGVYRFPSDSPVMISDGADVSLELVLESSPRIKPDSYSFEFDVRSRPGFASETENESLGSDHEANVTVETGSVTTSVDVTSNETDANVTVQSYEEVTVAPPEPDNEFVGGVGVEVSGKGEVEASGNITVSYDQAVVDQNNLDEDSMSVYYYNESRGVWTTEGVEVVERDTLENSVTAEADHFSTYAAYAEEEETQQDDGSDSDDSADTFFVQTSSEDEENQTQDSQNEDETESETGQDQSQEDAQQQEEDTQNQQESEGTQQENNQEQSQDQGITGQFLGSPTNIGGIIVAVLVAMVAALQYFGKIEIRAVIELVREKLEEFR